MKGEDLRAMVIVRNSFIPINDLVPNDDEWVFEGCFNQIKRLRDYYTPIFGAPSKSAAQLPTNAWCLRQRYSSNVKMQCYCNSTNHIEIPALPVDSVFHTFKMDKNGIIIDGTAYSFANRVQGDTLTARFSFGDDGGGQLIHGWKFFKAYHNGVLLFDLIPKEDATGKLGFYNKLTGTYYYSGANKYQPIWYDEYLQQNT